MLFESLVYGPVTMTSFCHYLSFCHHFVIIHNVTTEIVYQLQDQWRNQVILKWDPKGHCCHWIDECFLAQYGSVISNNKICMWVCCSCTLPIGLKLVLLLQILFFVFLYLLIGFNSRFQAQIGWFIMSHKVATKKSRFLVKCSI